MQCDGAHRRGSTPSSEKNGADLAFDPHSLPACGQPPQLAVCLAEQRDDRQPAAGAGGYRLQETNCHRKPDSDVISDPQDRVIGWGFGWRVDGFADVTSPMQFIASTDGIGILG